MELGNRQQVDFRLTGARADHFSFMPGNKCPLPAIF